MNRILIISPMLPGIGGVSVSSNRLFLNLKKDGYDVDAFNIRFKNRKQNKPLYLALKYFTIPFYILFQRKYDIIHCHVPGVLRKLYISLFKPFYKGAKLVFTIHGDAHPLVDNKFVKYVLRKADKIICVQVGDSAKMPDGLTEKSVDIPAFILPRVIDTTFTPKSILEFCENKGESKLLIFNGAAVVNDEWNDLYGFEDMVAAFKALESRGQYRLLMILNGTPKNRRGEELIKKIKVLISDECSLKFVENEPFELCPLFKCADVYVRPTKTDGDSLSVREALAMGCKVVTTNVVNRPQGVFLYEKPSQLADTIELAIESETPAFAEQKDYYQYIKELYAKLLPDA